MIIIKLKRSYYDHSVCNAYFITVNFGCRFIEDDKNNGLLVKLGVSTTPVSYNYGIKLIVHLRGLI
jgi:hypothetical protein